MSTRRTLASATLWAAAASAALAGHVGAAVWLARNPLGSARPGPPEAVYVELVADLAAEPENQPAPEDATAVADAPAAEAEPQPDADAQAEPEPQAESEAVSEHQVASEPLAEPEPEPEPEPETPPPPAQAQPIPAPLPLRAPQALPLPTPPLQPDPHPAPDDLPIPAPEPEPLPEPEAEPRPEPEAIEPAAPSITATRPAPRPARVMRDTTPRRSAPTAHTSRRTAAAPTRPAATAAPQAASRTAAPQGSGGAASARAEQGWQADVQRRVARHMQRTRLPGGRGQVRAVLHLSVAANGAVNARLAQPTGNPQADAAVQRQAAAMPTLPAPPTGKATTLVLPVVVQFR